MPHIGAHGVSRRFKSTGGCLLQACVDASGQAKDGDSLQRTSPLAMGKSIPAHPHRHRRAHLI